MLELGILKCLFLFMGYHPCFGWRPVYVTFYFFFVITYLDLLDGLVTYMYM